MDSELKLKTAGTLKWNAIDRVSSQVLYAVVGIVLANILTPEDFGLVGALLVFQAFAILFVDSGFGAALLQRKDPDEKDYSTVFWFNLGVSAAVYIILFFAAPLIADIFQGDKRLIPLSRVMFLTFVLNGLAIVQTNRLMKRMDVKQIAISNLIGLTTAGAVGVCLALRGFGAWALVWQSVTLSAVKSGWLWLTGRWLPKSGFHLSSLKKIWRIGLSVFSSSAFNTLCQNIYSFIIGAFYNLASLGLYTQADKWSKMGSASISQILTASFVPLLSSVQDDAGSYHRYIGRINAFTGFILFPVMLGGATVGIPLFHGLFGEKWDGAILLFQILMIRGIFVVLTSLHSNYLLSLGYGKRLFAIEAIKDTFIIVAILSTVWIGTVSALVWGQLIASLTTFVVSMIIVCRATGYGWQNMLRDISPSMGLAIAACIPASLVIWIHPFAELGSVQLAGILELIVALVIGGGCYVGLCAAFQIKELKEAIQYFRGKFGKKNI